MGGLLFVRLGRRGATGSAWVTGGRLRFGGVRGIGCRQRERFGRELPELSGRRIGVTAAQALASVFAITRGVGVAVLLFLFLLECARARTEREGERVGILFVTGCLFCE